MLHGIARSRENAIKLTEARSAEMVASIESLLVMIRQEKSGFAGFYCVRNRRVRASSNKRETCANGQMKPGGRALLYRRDSERGTPHKRMNIISNVRSIEAAVIRCPAFDPASRFRKPTVDAPVRACPGKMKRKACSGVLL